GSEARVVARRNGFDRARAFSAWRNRLTRTVQSFGRTSSSAPGGHIDYVIVHGAKRQTVQRYRVFSTPNASDHNLVLVKIKE
ncbi:MAG: hypothetical protein ACK5LJ_15920, partial [Paracoccus sp. (in: a-proteobacteria)]